MKTKKYLDVPGKVLPYQRNFNFVTSTRGTGKTYGIQKFLLKKALNGEQFAYLVRTKTEQQRGAFGKAFAKVAEKEYRDYDFVFTDDVLIYNKEILGYCLPLSAADQLKKESFPKVKYLYFDEYILESGSSSKYVHGWKEPDLLLSLYHTIDREEDRVIVFLTGNTISFYNPYHLHPAFSIPNISPGGVWLSDNILYWHAEPTVTLSAERKENRFLNMVEKSEYGAYAVEGNFYDGGNEFIAKRTSKARYVFTLIYFGNPYGIWFEDREGYVVIDKGGNLNYRNVFALTPNDRTENSVLIMPKTNVFTRWIATHYKHGNVFYTSPEVRERICGAIRLML